MNQSCYEDRNKSLLIGSVAAITVWSTAYDVSLPTDPTLFWATVYAGVLCISYTMPHIPAHREYHWLNQDISTDNLALYTWEELFLRSQIWLARHFFVAEPWFKRFKSPERIIYHLPKELT